MSRLVERRAAAAVRAACARVAGVVGLPGVAVEVGEDGVRVRGRGLRDRLRWVAGMLK